MSVNKLKIKLFGEAWRLKKINLNEALLKACEETAEKMKQPLIKLITDPFFYHYLKIKSMQSPDDFEGEFIEGLINSSKNQIEIWFKNRKVRRLIINDLYNEFLLFPLYNAKTRNFNTILEKGLYIEQKEIGLIGCFEININEFNIENLEFHLLEDKEMTILEKIFYNNQPLNFEKKDSLITFQNCFEV